MNRPVSCVLARLRLNKTRVVFLIAGGVLVASVSCRSHEQSRTTEQIAVSSPTPEQTVSWSSSDLIERLEDNKALKRAWEDFERSQKYRLAQPSDRRLSTAAMARVKSNNPNQIIPFLTWWGAQGYVGRPEFLIAIVVDPSRSDPNRYGLVVIAAPKSEGAGYKTYWAMQEQDMESCLISPASGSVFMECFRRDGALEMKELVWQQRSHQFRLL